MILSCPTCATRYRHAALPVGCPARCGQCDQVFPVPPARSYFVRAVSPVQRTLASAIAGAELPRQAASPLSGGVSFDMVDPDESADEPWRVMPSISLDRRSAPLRAASPPLPTPETLGSIAGVFLAWVALGVGLGFGLRFILGGPMRIWSAVGAAAGLVAGWGWRQWMSGRS